MRICCTERKKCAIFKETTNSATGEAPKLYACPGNIQAVRNTVNIARWLESAGVSGELQRDFCGRMLESDD